MSEMKVEREIVGAIWRVAQPGAMIFSALLLAGVITGIANSVLHVWHWQKWTPVMVSETIMHISLAEWKAPQIKGQKKGHLLKNGL